MSNKYFVRSSIIAAVLLFASSFYYLPFYVSKPGMAKELEPIIEVEDGYDTKGAFMLTTIRMGRANIYTYVLAKMNDYQEVYPIEEIRRKDESDEEYNVRQLHMMDASKTTAIEVAYKTANLPVSYDYKGVYVLNVIKNMPADGILKPGDRIFQVDDVSFESSEEFIQYVSKKSAGTQIELTYKRGKETLKDVLVVEPFEENNNKVGVGIGLVDDREIKVSPEVNVETDDIGGPSAGLMFTLEIYNQLIEEDLTRGYKIAGTGTILPDGIVGPIGGIEQKVVAADKAGADIFLAPNENGEKDSNYEAALKTAKDINTKMKIIPIDNFQEAVNYLMELKQKTS